MRVLVCGGRAYEEREHLFVTLDRLHRARGITLVIAGGARGADTLAEEWAKDRSVPHQIFHAEWDTLGRPAGPIRNQRMLDEGKPDLVVAFPGGKGTADMVRRAYEAGVRVMEVEDAKTQEERDAACLRGMQQLAERLHVTPTAEAMERIGRVIEREREQQRQALSLPRGVDVPEAPMPATEEERLAELAQVREELERVTARALDPSLPDGPERESNGRKMVVLRARFWKLMTPEECEAFREANRKALPWRLK